jgi:hypothetical protein
VGIRAVAILLLEKHYQESVISADFRPSLNGSDFIINLSVAERKVVEDSWIAPSLSC